MTDGMGLLDSEQLPALPSQPSGAPPLHLWRLGTGSSRFCVKKFPSSFSLRVKKFPSSFWLRVKSFPFCMGPGVKVPQKRGVSRGFWRVFSWPWPASWVSELPSSRFLMFSQRRPAPPSPLALLPQREGRNKSGAGWLGYCCLGMTIFRHRIVRCPGALGKGQVSVFPPDQGARR